MKLDSPNIDLLPPEWRGVVDVYEMYGKWIARLWPRPPKHPRTPAQLANWRRFKRMVDMRKQFDENQVKAWRTLPLPPNRSYDDIARSALLKLLASPPFPSLTGWFSSSARRSIWRLCYSSIPDRWFGYRTAFIYFPGLFSDLEYVKRTEIYFTEHASATITWSQNGTLCYRGKRDYPHYVPSFVGWEQVGEVPTTPIQPGGPAQYIYLPPRNYYNRIFAFNNGFIQYEETCWEQPQSNLLPRINGHFRIAVLLRYRHPLQQLDSYILACPPTPILDPVDTNPACNSVNEISAGYVQWIIDPGPDW